MTRSLAAVTGTGTTRANWGLPVFVMLEVGPVVFCGVADVAGAAG
ncbi:MAG TPA: hypothetical protein VLT34_14135 [Arthrobacter sp.]|nr:hypothetical protein [Arthrobacter sp.]